MINARWYVLHAYSGYEKKVSENIMEQAKKLNISELIENVSVPTQNIVEVKRGTRVNTERRFFPGYIFHRTDEYEGEEKRVSIAFDLWQTKYFGRDENGRVPSPLATKTFMNEEIANEIRSS